MAISWKSRTWRVVSNNSSTLPGVPMPSERHGLMKGKPKLSIRLRWFCPFWTESGPHNPSQRASSLIGYIECSQAMFVLLMDPEIRPSTERTTAGLLNLSTQQDGPLDALKSSIVVLKLDFKVRHFRKHVDTHIPLQKPFYIMSYHDTSIFRDLLPFQWLLTTKRGFHAFTLSDMYYLPQVTSSLRGSTEDGGTPLAAFSAIKQPTMVALMILTAMYFGAILYNDWLVMVNS